MTMGFTAKGKRDSSSHNSESWGLGFFLVFFPDINEQEQHPSSTINDNINTSKNTFKSTLNSTSSLSPSSSPSPSPLTRRPTSPYPHLLSKAQSTISICALLVFLSLLLFTLSSFESSPSSSSSFSTRRHLSSSSTFPKPITQNTPQIHSSPALQGLGNLYRKGTKPMNDLIVGHVSESLTDQELRLFLRLFYKSPLSSKSDLSFIFPSASDSSSFQPIISQETDSFFKLVNKNETQSSKPTDSTLSDGEREVLNKGKEPIWGRGVQRDDSTRLSYGSVVSFVADELDPENSLSGFLDHVAMGMRRWACYPMLLGRVRKNFKHVMLLDVKEVLILGDPLSRIRNKSPESVLLLSTDAGIVHNKKRHSVKTQLPKRVNPAVVMGGARGVRRLSSAMLNEIVRVTTQGKKKNSVTESGLFNQLVGNEFLLKNVNVLTTAETIPDASSLSWVDSNSGSSSLSSSNYTMLRRGNSDTTAIILKHVCGLEINSSVYSDCS